MATRQIIDSTCLICKGTDIKQVCVETCPSAFNMVLPAFAAECMCQVQSIPAADAQARQQTSHMLLLLLSIDGTDGRTDTYIDAVPRTVHAASIWLRISKNAASVNVTTEF